jgi:isopentenyldiphosphate isomerase
MSELIIIVDEKDNQIGTKERSDIDESHIYRASGLWITNSKGEILLAKRNYDKKISPGCWGPAASGTVNMGETYEENLYKEAEEELGLTGLKFKEFMHGRLGTNHFVKFFRLNADIYISDLKLQEEEVDSVAWFDPEDLKQRIKAHPEEFVESALKWEEIGLL